MVGGNDAVVGKDELARVHENEQTCSPDREGTDTPRGSKGEGRPDDGGGGMTDTRDGGMEPSGFSEDRLLSVQDFIKVITNDRVVDVIVESLLQEFA